jgi:hypothetical protein
VSSVAVQINGLYVPLTECDWVWRDPCGCPFGVMSAATSRPAPHVLAADEEAAWRGFYDTARERNAARKKGVTTELMTHKRYSAEVMPLLRAPRGHSCALGPTDQSGEVEGQTDLFVGDPA